MPILTTNDGSIHIIEDATDFINLIKEYMGYESSSYLEDLVLEFEGFEDKIDSLEFSNEDKQLSLEQAYEKLSSIILDLRNEDENEEEYLMDKDTLIRRLEDVSYYLDN